MWASVEHPDLCRALFLIAPAIHFVERHSRNLPPEELERWRRGEPIRVEKEWFTVDLESDLLHETEFRAVSRLERRFSHPARIVHGSEDETIPLADVEAFVEECVNPDLSLRVVPGGDHRLTDHLDLLVSELLKLVPTSS